MAGPSDLFDTAQELLAAAAAALETTPGGGIAYQAVWQGLPVWDCPPMLTVHAGGPSIAPTTAGPVLGPMQRIVVTGEVNIVSFTVTVLRCVPSLLQRGQSTVLPSAADETASSQVCYADAWAVWNYLKNAHRAGTLFQRPSGRREFALIQALPLRTSGAAGGWEIHVGVEVGGYA